MPDSTRRTPKTAQQSVEGTQTAYDRGVEYATDNAVVAPQFVGYAAALTDYGNREDVESLVARRRREAAETFDAQAFRRTTADDEPAQPAAAAGGAVDYSAYVSDDDADGDPDYGPA